MFARRDNSPAGAEPFNRIGVDIDRLDPPARDAALGDEHGFADADGGQHPSGVSVQLALGDRLHAPTERTEEFAVRMAGRRETDIR